MACRGGEGDARRADAFPCIGVVGRSACGDFGCYRHAGCAGTLVGDGSDYGCHGVADGHFDIRGVFTAVVVGHHDTVNHGAGGGGRGRSGYAAGGAGRCRVVVTGGDGRPNIADIVVAATSDVGYREVG